MFVDGRQTSHPRELSYDVVIVGAGPAGITLAKELQGSGLRIALLESGDRDFDADTQELYDAGHTGNEQTDLLAGRLRYFGGTSNHWGGHCLPLDKIDFARAPANGMSGWPISYDDVLPYYRRAHDYCDLGEFDYDYASFPSIRDEDLLLPGNREIDTVAFRQSPPTRFGEKYGPWLDAQNNLDVWLNTNLVDIVTSADGTVEQVVTRTLTGIERLYKARAFVLACGAVETARLLLYTNEKNGRIFGNSSGLLGRCYLDHPSGGAAFVHFEHRISNKIYWRDADYLQDDVPVRFMLRLSEKKMLQEKLNNCQFIVIPFADTEEGQQRSRDAKTSLNSLKSIAKWVLNYDEDPRFSLSGQFCEFITNADAFAAQTFVNTFQNTDGYKRILLKYEAEQLPDSSNGIKLTAARDALDMPKISLHWSVSEDDIASIQRTTQIFGRAFGQAELGRLQMEDHGEDPYWGSTTAWHQLGTTRMAQEPRDGVVDKNCRVWGTNNLYVASGGVMPTSGRANPTLTIVALTIRLSDHLTRDVLR